MKPHQTRVSVRYHESDQMGVVHHAVYVHYFEVARTTFMAEVGLDYAAMERRGVLLAVVDVGLRYLAPARFGDELIVETVVRKADRVRVRFDYRVLSDEEQPRLLCEGHTLLACVNRDLRPQRLPEPDRERLLSVLAPES